MAEVKVTVLTTLYNKGPFVEEAVRSVLDGPFTDFELLVVDDGSMDDGIEVVRAIDDPRVRILTSERNTGRAAAANRGYDAARGEYIAVLDADDIAHPERLAKQVAFLDTHPEVGALGSFARSFGAEEETHTWPATDAECRGLLLFSDPVLYGTCMLRRSVVEANRLRCDPNWLHPGMDYLFLITFSPFTRYANLQEVLVHYRVGEQNMRHGQDPYFGRAHIYEAAFRYFDIAASSEQIELQLMLHRLFRRPPNATRVKQLFAWVSQLKNLNRERGLFTQEVFETRLDRDLDKLFHTLADHGLAPALTHARLSRNWSADRLAYLAKVRLRELFGG